jgi:hypothetical protein
LSLKTQPPWSCRKEEKRLGIGEREKEIEKERAKKKPKTEKGGRESRATDLE